jgi:hypothetical protein
MIRVFKLFCKINFINISALDFFLKSISELKIFKTKCPFCKTKYPGWKSHSDYSRYLVSYEKGQVVSYQITIDRYMCSSCGHTHALLPEIIIPYRSYSFIFVISVMRDYYKKTLRVVEICNKYNISVSTLYSWKKLFHEHKKLWLGLLEDACISHMKFVDSFFTGTLLYFLEEFFQASGISFMQRTHIKKAKYNPP